MVAHQNAYSMRIAAILLLVGACLALTPLLSAQNYKLRRTLEGHTKGVVSLNFSPNGKTLVSASDDRTVHYWDVATGKNSFSLKDEESAWRSTAFSPDGKTLATGGDGNNVKLWEAGKSKGAILINESHQCPPPLVVFSPNGTMLASGGQCQNAIQLWDVASGKETGKLVTQGQALNPWGVRGMVFTPDGKHLYSVGYIGGIRKWDVATRKEVSLTVSPAQKRHVEQLIANLGSAKFTDREEASKQLEEFGPLALELLRQAIDNPDAEIRKRAAKLVTLLKSKKPEENLGYQSVFSPDCKFLANATCHDGVKVWDVSTGKECCAFNQLSGQSLAFDPDSKTLAFGSDSGQVILCDVSTGKLLGAFSGHSKGVSSLAYSPDGKSLASGSEDGIIKIWDVAMVDSTK